MVDAITYQDAVIKVRLPGDLRVAAQRRALDDGGWSFQQFVVAALRAYLADPDVARTIRAYLCANAPRTGVTAG